MSEIFCMHVIMDIPKWNLSWKQLLLNFNLINSTNNQTIGLVSKENAVDIVDNLSQWEQTVTAVKAGMAVDENAVKAIQQNVATKLAQLSGSSDPYVIQYYYDELTNNLY